MQTGISREPVELSDEDLDLIAGGNGLSISVGTDINVTVINQLIEQIQLFSTNVTTSALANASVTQTA